MMRFLRLRFKKAQKSRRTEQAYWLEVIKAQQLSGLSQQKYCEKERISYGSFKNRVSRLKEGMADNGTFVPAIVAPEPMPFKQDPIYKPESALPLSNQNLELRCGRFHILVPPEFDEVALGRLVGVIKGHV